MFKMLTVVVAAKEIQIEGNNLPAKKFAAVLWLV